VIDTPGNYQLSENLTCLVGIPPGLFCDKAAITITPNVHLDGQGFTLTGSLFIGIGIQITAPDVQVRNITVESFDTGIEIREGHSNHLEAVNLQGNSRLFCSGGIGLRLINTTDNHVNKSNISGTKIGVFN
jgi:nitrous oxidase accessory protein NosD